MGAVKMLDTPQLPQIPETQTYSKQVNYGGAPVPFDFTKAAEALRSGNCRFDGLHRDVR